MNERREGALLPDPQGRMGGPAVRRVPAAARVFRGVGRSAVGRIATLGGALAVVLLLLPTFPAAGVTQTMDVMILAPQREFEVGDAVPLTIHVLRSGVHEDADAIELFAGVLALRVVRVDTGVYQSTYRILPEDGMAGGARILVVAWSGGIRDQQVLDLAVGGLEVDVSASPVAARPGTFIDITITIRDNGVPRDAERMLLEATLETAGGQTTTDGLDWMQLDVGTYVSTYQVPKAIAQTSTLYFAAQADVAGVTVNAGVDVFVEVPARLVVWHHTISAGAGIAVVEIFAANETARPAAGAAVGLTYEYFNESGKRVREKVLRDTDERGIASFTINHAGARSNVAFWGTVTADAASVGFSGSLPVPKADFARRVEVLREDPFEVVAPGERATVRYAVLQGGAPVASQTLYYFARTREAFVAAGVVTSDASGRFAIELTPPAGETIIEFSAQVGGVWVTEADWILAAKHLSVEIGELYVGAVAHVSASLPAGAPRSIAFIEFRPYTDDWSPARGGRGAYDIVASKGTIIEHDLVVPRFLPKGQEYLLSIEAIPLDPSSADRYVYLGTITIENRAPVANAVLSSPVVTIGSEVEVNASRSSDLDGAVDACEVDWGDGTTTAWSANATASHAYSEPGDYNITVRVRDDDGSVGEAFIGIHVEAPAGDILPLSLIVVALAALCAAAAFPFVGPRVVRGLAKPRGTVARRTE